MATRLAQLEEKLAARTNAEGKPLKGYVRNVAAITKEISRIKTTTNLVGPKGS